MHFAQNYLPYREPHYVNNAITALEHITNNITVNVIYQEAFVAIIDTIVIHHAVRTNGNITQSIDIYYNCVGIVDVSTTESIPEKEISLITRKGVALTYSFPKAQDEVRITRVSVQCSSVRA